jgi:transposase
LLTQLTDDEWDLVVDIFRQVRSRRGDKGRDDRRFLQALHYFAVHNITWRALPAEFGDWNTVWKRFWRLSQTGTFEAFFLALASCSRTAGIVQMFDSTSVRAHVSAAGAKGGSKIRRLAAPGAVSARKSTSNATLMGYRSTSTSPQRRPPTAGNFRLCSR